MHLSAHLGNDQELVARSHCTPMAPRGAPLCSGSAGLAGKLAAPRILIKPFGKCDAISGLQETQGGNHGPIPGAGLSPVKGRDVAQVTGTGGLGRRDRMDRGGPHRGALSSPWIPSLWAIRHAS